MIGIQNSKAIKELEKVDTRFKKIQIDILNDSYKVIVIIGDMKKCNKYLQNYFGEKKDLLVPDNQGKCLFVPKFYPVMWVRGDLPYPVSIGVLSHEAIHAVSFIMDYLGMDIKDQTGNELLAHSVSAIVRKVLKVKRSKNESNNNKRETKR